jgi:LysM repeat protein
MKPPPFAALLGTLGIGVAVACTGASTPAVPGEPVPSAAQASPSSPEPTPAVLSTPSPVVSPLPALERYVVVAGDSFSQIAAHFGVTVEALLALNPSIDDPDRIAVADVIRVPVRTVGTVIRIEGPDYRHLRLGESSDLVVVGSPQLAGEYVHWQLVEASSRPATWPTGSLPWQTTEGQPLDTDGRRSEYVESLGSEHVWRAYRARVPATATHPELWTQTVVMEWGGDGPCPAGITERWSVERLVAPDGTTYDVVPGEDAEFNGQWTIVVTNAGGVPGAGWRRVLERCWEPHQAVVGSDATAYFSVAYRTGESSEVVQPGRLIVAGPEGYRGGRPLKWHHLESAPDGTVFAIRTDAPHESPDFLSMSVAALDPDGNAKPGWPYTTTDLTSWPVYGPDGTVYLAQSTDVGDRLIALDADGQIKAGWPYPVPGKLEWTVCGAGCADVPRWPQVSPDGSVYDSFDSGIYIVGPDGQARAGWPYVLPKGTSIPHMLGTPGWSAIPPVIGGDGQVYVPWHDERSGAPHDDLICLTPGGAMCPGWPVRLPQRAAREVEIDEDGIVHVWLADDPGAPPSLEIKVRPDGTIVD